MKDAALTRLFLRFRRDRDGAALAAVFDALARELLEVAAHLVQDVDEAEDLVQSTFRVAIERANAFDRDRSLRAWLYGILAREAAKSRRRAARCPDASALERPPGAEPLERMIADEVPAVLRAAIDRLPAPYREVVRPVVCDGRSPRDVARELDRAPGTVRVQVQRGLEKLRRLLPREYGTAHLAFSLPGRGLDALRDAVWRHAGLAGAQPTVLAVAAQSASAAIISSPATWLAPGAALLAGIAWVARIEPPDVRSEGGNPERPLVDAAGSAAAGGSTLAGVSGPDSSRVPLLPSQPPPTVAPATEAMEEPAEEASIQVTVADEVDLDEGTLSAVWIQGLSPGLEAVGRSSPLVGRRSRFSGLAAGRYRIWTLNSRPPNLQPVDVEVEEGRVAAVVLRPGTITLHGRLLCGIDFVADVRVFCTGRMRACGVLRSDGSYEVVGLAPGDYELSVGGESAYYHLYDVHVQDDGSGRMSFDVRLPTAEIVGMVRGVEFRRDDREVQVFPRGWGVSAGNRGSRARVDDAGQFRMRFVPPGDYKVFVWASTPRARPASIRVGRGDGVHRVLLEPPPHTTGIRGRITDPPRRDGWSLLLVHRDSEGHAFGLHGGYALADHHTGEFTLEDVEPGTYGVHVSNDSNGGTHLWIPDLVVPPHGIHDLHVTIPEGRRVAIRLEPDEDSRLSIWYLRYSSGERIPFYSFIGTQPRGLRASARPFGLPLGEYVVEADFGDGQLVRRPLHVAPGEGVLELVVRPERGE